jgi:hypothetical protein
VVGVVPPDGSYDVAVEGDTGQVILFSSSHDLVIVRFGTEYGQPVPAWPDLFSRFRERAAPEGGVDNRSRLIFRPAPRAR